MRSVPVGDERAGLDQPPAVAADVAVDVAAPRHHIEPVLDHVGQRVMFADRLIAPDHDPFVGHRMEAQVELVAHEHADLAGELRARAVDNPADDGRILTEDRRQQRFVGAIDPTAIAHDEIVDFGACERGVEPRGSGGCGHRGSPCAGGVVGEQGAARIGGALGAFGNVVGEAWRGIAADYG